MSGIGEVDGFTEFGSLTLETDDWPLHMNISFSLHPPKEQYDTFSVFPIQQSAHKLLTTTKLYFHTIHPSKLHTTYDDNPTS